MGDFLKNSGLPVTLDFVASIIANLKAELFYVIF